MNPSDEVSRLRQTQRECADAHRKAETEVERRWHMLGIADYLMEEVLLTYELEIGHNREP